MTSAETQKAGLRVLFAASEAEPFARTGGLGDVAGSLPRALKDAGTQVAVIMPKYSCLAAGVRESLQPVATFTVELGWRQQYCGIEKLERDGLTYYFVDNEYYFKRDKGLYGYYDDGERFAYYAKAICEAVNTVPELACDVIHCNDWQTALVPVYLKTSYGEDSPCSNVSTVFTIHNVKFQGCYDKDILDNVLGIPSASEAGRNLTTSYEAANYMLGALRYTNFITTVSPTYAQEIQTPTYGEGLDQEFRNRAEQLRGILNGIDCDAWNPETDTFLTKTFSAKKPAGKAACKAALQKELGLAEDAATPLVVMVTRLTEQKGLSLVRASIERMMATGLQLAVLGTGDAEQEEAFTALARRYPGQMSTTIAFDNALSHRMYAGADMLLMPSAFEPCGLSQMIALRYGTVPVVRETGGLKDSVVPYKPGSKKSNGFSFPNMDPNQLAETMEYACDLYKKKPKSWETLRKHAFRTNLGWLESAKDYQGIYELIAR
ncbi:MAG: glycogen synthase GlgA [Coriobacteriia bacterium]|nr:glycogen synthase GlgA [Coriobacteriia bacterium]